MASALRSHQTPTQGRRLEDKYAVLSVAGDLPDDVHLTSEPIDPERCSLRSGALLPCLEWALGSIWRLDGVSPSTPPSVT